MTFFKQMALAISFIIIVMLASVMVLNYQAAKKDMIESLYETTVNNISALSSKLSEAVDDSVEIASIIDAEFDSGYYKMIVYHSADGNSDYKQVDNEQPEGVPQWFIDFTDIHLKSVRADVSSGWSIAGEVEVLGDTGVIYKTLYKMFIKLLYLFVIFLIIALVMLSVMLHFMLKPLYRIQKQAEAILHNEFIVQEKLPYTTEFRDVVVGMNAMVKKVEEIFQKGNEALQRNKELLYKDSVTKLFNRRYLMLKLKDLIALENKTNGGSVIFIALSSIEALNQAIGRQKAEEILVELAEYFQDITKEYNEKVIARVNEVEFTFVLPDCELDKASNLAKQVNVFFAKLQEKYELNQEKIFINIGIYRYHPSDSMGEVLTRADSALSYAKAKEHENIHCFENKDTKIAIAKEQWRAILENAMEHNYFALKFWDAVTVPQKTIPHKVMTFTIDNKEEKYFYGDFIAPAINLGMVSKMYIRVLEHLFMQEHKELEGVSCAIRISNEFLKDEKGYEELSFLFEKYAKKLRFNLIFEVSDSLAIHHTALVLHYVELFRKYGFGFGINSFTGESNDFTYLKKLNPQFLKADSAFLLDQSQDSMNALQLITDSLGIEIIATFVKDQEELQKIESYHIKTLQGPITDKLLQEG